jgi:hypothetical protein
MFKSSAEALRLSRIPRHAKGAVPCQTRLRPRISVASVASAVSHMRFARRRQDPDDLMPGRVYRSNLPTAARWWYGSRRVAMLGKSNGGIKAARQLETAPAVDGRDASAWNSPSCPSASRRSARGAHPPWRSSGKKQRSPWSGGWRLHSGARQAVDFGGSADVRVYPGPPGRAFSLGRTRPKPAAGGVSNSRRLIRAMLSLCAPVRQHDVAICWWICGASRHPAAKH